MTTSTIESPDDDAAREFISAALAERSVVCVFARCEAEYTGRDAGGYLSPGDCLVVVKPDGTVLVHAEDGHKPRNWQTGGGTVYLDTSDAGELCLCGRQSNPDENLVVYLTEVYSVTRYDTELVPDLELEGTEDDMHEYILDNPDEVDPGLRPTHHEDSNAAGRVDVFAYDADGTPVLVEVKRRQASPKHVDQLLRYVNLYRDETDDDRVRGILVAPSASDRTKRVLRDNNLEFVALSPFDVDTSHPQNASLGDF